MYMKDRWRKIIKQVQETKDIFEKGLVKTFFKTYKYKFSFKFELYVRAYYRGQLGLHFYLRTAALRKWW